MTAQDFLSQATRKLHSAGIDTARLDCLVLMEDVLKQDRALLLAHLDMLLSSTQVTILNNLITQREQHIPLAYIRGKAAFFGRYFTVSEYVLVPRPESEIMIEMLLQTTLGLRPRIVDVGTGSGCLGITAALELPEADVYLLDIEPNALEVAKLNAQKLKADVHIVLQDLLGNAATTFDVVLANLPYVPNEYPINAAAGHEPAIALFAGHDGLAVYRKFWRQVEELEQQPAHIFTESLPEQHDALKDMALSTKYTLQASQGYIQHFVTG